MSEVNSVNGKTGAVVLTASNVEAVPTSEVGQPSGVAALNGSGVLPESQLPAAVVSSGAPLPSGGDDTALLQAAMPAKGLLILKNNAKYQLVGMLTIPTGVDVLGGGGNLTAGQSATELLCTAEGAGVTIEGIGGITGCFTVNGNKIATAPLTRIGGAERTLIALSAIESAQDNWTILASQNDLYLGCNTQYATRDNLVIDKGAGGCIFVRYEDNGPGRYGLRLDDAITGGPYSVPTHIEFLHAIIERGTTATTNQLRLNAFQTLAFRSCVIQGTELSGPFIDITAGSGTVLFDGGYVQGSSEAVSTAISIGNGPVLVVQGDWSITGFLNGIELAGTNPTVQILGRINWSSIKNRYTGTGSENTSVRTRKTNPIESSRTAASSSVLLANVLGDIGLRFEVNAEGKLQWNYGGSGFSFPTHLGVRSDGNIEASPNLYA